MTTLPRVHVALVGFDKLVPDLKSALRILKALPRNATGQLISTYVTWITGPTECTSAPNGRKEMHIVFLDNGRLALAETPCLPRHFDASAAGLVPMSALSTSWLGDTITVMFT